MAKYTIDSSTLTAIANAIRQKRGTSSNILVSNFASEILLINGGGERPIVPQTGTWQLKASNGKKYVILGTDDDIAGNAKYFRMLRSFGFPYTMNTEAEHLNVELASDDDSSIFTEADAPALFPDGCTVTELATYLSEHSTLGETAQHGESSNKLWNSELLVGDVLTTAYNAYVAEGGTKNETEFANACKTIGASTDLAQGASYVADSRATLEEAIGDYVYTLGIWGGTAEIEVDGITVNLSACHSDAYPFRANNYFGASSRLSAYRNNTSPFDISRDSDNLEALSELDNVGLGKCIELFIHNTSALDYSTFRTQLTTLKGLVDSGKVQVVTRKQYADLGEYVSNPVVSISASRDGDITLHEEDDLSKYTVIATFADNTTEDVTTSAFIGNSDVDVDTEGNYIVPCEYKGFTSTVNVVVSGGGSASVNLYPTYKMHGNYNTGAWTYDETKNTEWGSSDFVPYDTTKDYLISFNGTDSNNHTRPRLTKIYCYDSDKVYLGYLDTVSLLIQGNVTDFKLPHLDDTYATTAYVRMSGDLNQSYAPNQATEWSCTSVVRTTE